MKFSYLIVLVISVSSAFGAPQLLAQQVGDPVVRLVSRPRAVAHHIAPAAGPFAIRANPPILVSQAAEAPIAVPAPATPTIVTAARNSIFSPVSGPALLPVNAEPSVFQAPDGRIFALSNGVNTIQPGQLFQLSDGRIFTAAAGDQEPKQESLFDQNQKNEAVIDALRTAPEETNLAVTDNPVPEDNLEEAVEAAAIQEEEVKEEEPVVRAPQDSAPAPTTQLVRVQQIQGLFPNVPRLVGSPVVAPAAQIVSAQRTPVAFSNSDAVSTQYFNYPNFGIAYEF